MQIHDLLLRQLIIELTDPDPEKMVDNAIEQWQLIAAHIISIIGEGGFNALYDRSVILTQSTFPWLLTCELQPSAHKRFSALRASLEDQTTALASEANYLLLVNFTGILESLIGAELTTRIFRSALEETRIPIGKGVNK
ncbi:hypothetical protein SAMN06297280_0690 [Arsukibacterium tuosuense]|uniref:Uncharacterized protein n=1 Tax=Arsukibacterium tuosuense TaxID=1323745 RepID=A0A285I7W5_9GAMM|nr:hypothetical protein [Arsukibacterium tuosuense]SNY44095.1 hypothetical protein SAMN06297280_0690 [Arsukibacterium tuosuense]